MDSGQPSPAPVALLKQPADSGSTCSGSHSTESGKMKDALGLKRTR